MTISPRLGGQESIDAIVASAERRTSNGFHVDSSYEFAAPKFFDFSANMKESGSVVEAQSDLDKDWFGTGQTCIMDLTDPFD